MNMENEKVFANALNQITELGPMRLKMLRDYFGSYRDAWSGSESQFTAALGNAAVAHTVLEKKKTISHEESFNELSKHQIQLTLENDSDYPSALKTIAVPPALLYIEGALPPSDIPHLAIVGTRRPSHYGLEVCTMLTRDLAGAGMIIVSGLARGIDTKAHETALAVNSKTLAVIGSGIHRSVLYPAINRKLADRIVATGGAIISEYPLYMQAAPWTFPQRNRIIAGLSAGTVVVEAGEKSGALITANHALESAREVFAVPGDIFAQTAAGPHKLIKLGATPVTSSADILEAFGFDAAATASPNMETYTPDERLLLTALDEPRSGDELVVATQKDPFAINQLLSMLEIRGSIKHVGGGKYRKI